MRYFGVILLPLVLVVAGGCVAVPVPHPEYRIVQSRRWIKPEDTAGLRAGVTTRADVMCLLGEPDFWWGDDRVLAYQWTTSNLGVAWAAGGGGGGTAAAMAGFIDIPIHHFLLVSFDPQHRVTDVEFRDPPVGWLGPEFLQKLAAQTHPEAK